MSSKDSRPRTDDDLSYIADTMDRPRQEVADALGRSILAIRHMRRLVKYGDKRRTTRWSEGEDQVLRASAGIKTAEQIAGLLSGRTVKMVQGRLRFLGIKLGYYDSRNPLNVAHRRLLAKTCPKCGLLLPADWYLFHAINGRMAWRSACRKCNATEAPVTPRVREWRENKYAKMAQALTILLAENRASEYTESDHKVLADPSLTLLAKALILKRTYIGVRNQCGANGYKSYQDGLGDPAGDQWIIDNPNVDRIDEITASLNREPELVMAGRPSWDWDD